MIRDNCSLVISEMMNKISFFINRTKVTRFVFALQNYLGMYTAKDSRYVRSIETGDVPHLLLMSSVFCLLLMSSAIHVPTLW